MRRLQLAAKQAPPRSGSHRAASRTTQSILVVDVKEKNRSGCSRNDFLEGGGYFAIPPFSNTRVLNAILARQPVRQFPTQVACDLWRCERSTHVNRSPTNPVRFRMLGKASDPGQRSKA